MSVVIRPIDADEMAGLISQQIVPKLLEDHRAILNRSIYNSSNIWLGEEDGRVLCFWGLIPPTILSDIAYLWLYTAPELVEHKFLLVRHSQKAVKEMLKLYPTIVGHGQNGNDRSLAWLRWMGAEFGKPQGRLIPFEIRA